MRIQDLLKIANWVADKTIELVPYSSNRPSYFNQPFHRTFWLSVARCRNDAHGTREKVRKWHMDISQDTVPITYKLRRVKETFFNASSSNPTLQEWYNYILSLPDAMTKQHHKDGRTLSTINKLEWIAKNTVKFGIGNCGENAMVAFILLLEYPKEGLPHLGLPPLDEELKVEIISLRHKEGADHSAVVINRAPNSNLNDMSTWGPEVVIVDPWLDCVVAGDRENILPQPTSASYAYFKYYQKLITVPNNYFGYIGEGHTHTWMRHRQEKNQPVNLRHWSAFYKKESAATENVPWVEDDSAPSKRTKFK